MREKRKERREKIKKGASAGLMILIAMLAVLGTAAAQNETSSVSVNWTEIGGIIEGAAGIMPSVVTLITAVVPVLLILIVVGFVTGLFDGLIGGIQDAMRFLGRR